MRFRFALPLFLLLAAAPAATAHPLPNFRYDRKVDVRLTPQTVEVRYVLELSFWTIFTDGRNLFTPEEFAEINGRLREVTKRYCEKMAPILADRLRAKLDGTALTFRNTKAEIEQDRDHARFRYVFHAPWRPAGGGPEGHFDFEDQNFAAETGVMWLTVTAADEFEVTDLVEPTDLRGKHPTDLKEADLERMRKAAATFTAPTLPARPAEAPTPTEPTPVVEDLTPPDSTGLVGGLLARGPKALFDTDAGIGVLLLAAMAFGAFHAFAPGHGKTVAAAFLVGEQGTVRQAILLGISTTAAHTGTVMLIAAVFYFRYRDAVPASAQQWLGFVGGLLVLLVGFWLFVRRLRGQVDHVHLFGGCGHMCGQHPEPPKIPECRRPVRTDTADRAVYAPVLVPRKSPLSWVRVVLLGIGSGAIPCVDAVLLLMLAISAGRLAFALPLLVAFSVGLSAVLVLVGIVVVMLHRAGRRGFGENRWFRALPTLSAVLLMGMGIWMARDGLMGLVNGGP